MRAELLFSCAYARTYGRLFSPFALGICSFSSFMIDVCLVTYNVLQVCDCFNVILKKKKKRHAHRFADYYYYRTDGDYTTLHYTTLHYTTTCDTLCNYLCAICCTTSVCPWPLSHSPSKQQLASPQNKQSSLFLTPNFQLPAASRTAALVLMLRKKQRYLKPKWKAESQKQRRHGFPSTTNTYFPRPLLYFRRADTAMRSL